MIILKHTHFQVIFFILLKIPIALKHNFVHTTYEHIKGYT